MQQADLVLKSKAIFTGKSAEIFCGGVAIAGNRILAVGQDHEIDSLIGKGTRVYQFKDNLIMPGFNDAHIHLPVASIFNDESFCLDLSGCLSEDECVALVQEFAANHPDNAWIYGRGWNHWLWDQPVMPTRASLEKVVTDRPICLHAWDLHSAWVNNKALKLCGIDRNTPDPDGGTIEKFEDGEPSGLLSEAGAVLLVTTSALKVSEAKFKLAIQDFLRKANKFGVTSVGDVFPRAVAKENAYAVYQALEDEELLTARIHFYSELKSNLNEAKALQQLFTSEKLRFCGLKQLVDGVAEAHTAYLIEPYSDDPATRGALLISGELLKEQIIKADQEGFSVRLHTIGDAAVRFCLDCFYSAQVQNGRKGLRHALEHIENIQADDIPRLSQLGLIASMQPQHFTTNIGGYPVLLGEERVKRAWAIKSMLNAGAKYAFSSDCPVVEMNPIQGIHAAVTRTTEQGYPAGGWNPQERLSLAETLKGYTAGAAYLENFESELGTLEAGKLADIIVLSKNLFAIPEAEILNTKVRLTVMDGCIVYEDQI